MLFEIDVHVQDYFSHLGFLQEHYLHFLGREVEDAPPFLSEFLLQLLRKCSELAFLVFSELYCEDLAADSVLKLIVALPRDVVDGRLQ